MMDSGGSSNPRQKHPKRTGIIIDDCGRTTNITGNNHTDAENLSTKPQQSFKRAADQYMPIAHVVRIMRHVLPPHAKISDDAKETIQECVSEFINFVTTKAKERCHSEYRKTVSPDDVISAMGSLGFGKYADLLTIFLDKHRAQDPTYGNMYRHMPCTSRHGVHGLAAQMAQPPAIAPPGPSIPPMEHHGNYVRLPPQTGGYFMSDQGGREGSELDPFAELFR